jgi:hypothetical protein
MFEALLVLSLTLVPAQDKTQPPAKEATPSKEAQAKPEPGPLEKPAPEKGAPFASKEIEEIVLKVRQGMLMDIPRDNFVLRDVRTTYRNGSKTVNEVETRVNGVYTKIINKQANGTEAVTFTSPDGYYTITKGSASAGRGRGGAGAATNPTPSATAPANDAWHVAQQLPMDQYLKEQLAVRQRQHATEPFYFNDMRFPTNRPGFQRARHIIADEISRRNDAIEKVTKIQEGGKTLYRLHMNVWEGEEVYVDVDPDMKWAVVKVYTKGTNAPECEYTVELQKLANGNPYLKRFHSRQKDAGKEWRDVLTVEFTLQEGTKHDPAEYSLAFYGLAPEKQPWDPWAIGLMAAAGGLVLIVLLWFVIANRGKPAAQAATA